MKLVILLCCFTFFAGCTIIHDCNIFPALTSKLEDPNKKRQEIDPIEIMNDPLHNISIVSNCEIF